MYLSDGILTQQGKALGLIPTTAEERKKKGRKAKKDGKKDGREGEEGRKEIAK
jgi:hypothetical protein